jgi:hypothetical protein
MPPQKTSVLCRNLYTAPALCLPAGRIFFKKYLVTAYPQLIRLDSRFNFGLSATTIRTLLAINTGAFGAYPQARRWLELV